MTKRQPGFYLVRIKNYYGKPLEEPNYSDYEIAYVDEDGSIELAQFGGNDPRYIDEDEIAEIGPRIEPPKKGAKK